MNCQGRLSRKRIKHNRDRRGRPVWQNISGYAKPDDKCLCKALELLLFITGSHTSRRSSARIVRALLVQSSTQTYKRITVVSLPEVFDPLGSNFRDRLRWINLQIIGKFRDQLAVAHALKITEPPCQQAESARIANLKDFLIEVKVVKSAVRRDRGSAIGSKHNAFGSQVEPGDSHIPTLAAPRVGMARFDRPINQSRLSGSIVRRNESSHKVMWARVTT